MIDPECIQEILEYGHLYHNICFDFECLMKGGCCAHDGCDVVVSLEEDRHLRAVQYRKH